nr:lysM domain receptor-like kinase 4 [Malus domestica]
MVFVQFFAAVSVQFFAAGLVQFLVLFCCRFGAVFGVVAVFGAILVTRYQIFAQPGAMRKTATTLTNRKHGLLEYLILRDSISCPQIDSYLHSHEGYLQISFEEAWRKQLCSYNKEFSDENIKRVQIAHNVADAVNYLHNFSQPPCIHNNLKTSNILLDANLRAKVSNFTSAVGHFDKNQPRTGSRLERHSQWALLGTHGYMAPESIQNGVNTPKLDAFAVGVVLLDLLSGRSRGRCCCR